MIEAIKQLVDALEKANRQCSYHNIAPHCAYDEAIQAGKQAIAEVESQEPDIYPEEAYEMGLEAIAYYTHQPQRTWVGLAKEDRLCAKYMQDAPEGIEAVIDYIEAKLKQKNGFAEENT
jgi:hypothetical protein